jgi:DNA-binding HxlR family transcriptional regulator
MSKSSKSKEFCDFSRRSMCGISTLLDILGDKWSFLIIRDMMFRGKNTYGDFIKSDEKIATNILANRLQMLENTGIIIKEEFPGNKVKNIYKLTDKGRRLMPVLVEMILWSNEYYELSEKGQKFVESLKADKEGTMKQMLENLK